MDKAEFQGVVRNGQVVLDTPLDLPDGTAVTVSTSEVNGITPKPVATELPVTLAGMWAHRPEMADAEEWVRRLRGARE